MRKSLFAGLAALSLSLFAIPADAAVDAFIWFERGPVGESKNSGHAQWIELSSFSFGTSRGVQLRGNGGEGGAGKISVGEIVIKKHHDTSSAALKTAIVNQTVFKTLTLDDVKDGVTHYRYVLTDVLITSYRTVPNGSVDPDEQMSFNYGKIEYQYRQQKEDKSGYTEWKKRPEPEMRKAGG